MKAGRLSLKFIKYFVEKDILRRRELYPPHSFKEFIDIPYIDDGEVCHSYDVYLANKENRKNCCVIDIHGGAYILGEHQDNYPFAYELLQNGFDVVTVDYLQNNGKINTIDQIKDCVKCISHFLSSIKKYGLEEDCFVMAGDSAGGHFALLLSEAINNKEVASNIGIEHLELNIIGTVLNSPVYDLSNLGRNSLSNSGLKRLLGPSYKDLEHLKSISPNTYINTYDKPIFLSTSKYDFLRAETEKLLLDIGNRTNIFYLDIMVEDQNVDHVHNVTHPELKESKIVNDSISAFIDKLLSINK